MKKHIPEIQRNIAEGLGIDLSQVHVKVSSMDGRDEIAKKALKHACWSVCGRGCKGVNEMVRIGYFNDKSVACVSVGA